MFLCFFQTIAELQCVINCYTVTVSNLQLSKQMLTSLLYLVTVTLETFGVLPNFLYGSNLFSPEDGAHESVRLHPADLGNAGKFVPNEKTKKSQKEPVGNWWKLMK